MYVQDAILRGSLSQQQMGLMVFDPLLCDYDAVILLRRESIPQADLALQHPKASGGKRLRLLAKALAPAGFAGSEEDLFMPPKSARVLLRDVPKREPLPNFLMAYGSSASMREMQRWA